MGLQNDQCFHDRLEEYTKLLEATLRLMDECCGRVSVRGKTVKQELLQVSSSLKGRGICKICHGSGRVGAKFGFIPVYGATRVCTDCNGSGWAK
jgi:DnaJ-class molecular chaperone